MSIIDDLLVLVEDNEKISLEEIYEKLKNTRRQTIASSLGRLTSKGWLNKNKQGKSYLFSISKNGHETINKILDNIQYISDDKRPNNWDIVIFNIPEKNRKYRDEFRRQLVNYGYGRLHDSLWFSKVNLKDQIKTIVETMKIEKNVMYLSTSELTPNENKDLIEKLSWNWKDLNKEYTKFISQANKYLENKNKPRFKAKQLVYNLAKIVRSDPKLSPSSYPENHKYKEAVKLYKKLRPHCY